MNIYLMKAPTSSLYCQLRHVIVGKLRELTYRGGYDRRGDPMVWAHWFNNDRPIVKSPPEFSCLLRRMLRKNGTPSKNLIAPGDWPGGL